MASVISQPILENYLPVVLILMAVLLFILASEENIRVARPGIVLTMDFIANIFMLIVVYIRTAVLLESFHSSMIVTVVVHIGLCVITLLFVFNLIFTLALYFSRTMIRLKQELYCKVKFLLIRIGARKPEGYVILSYQKDMEMGFCNGECPICLMEFEKGDKCALGDKCEHTFHHLCLFQCLAISTRCPICRQSIEACTKEEERNASAS